jgi:hypothetical protein
MARKRPSVQRNIALFEFRYQADAGHHQDGAADPSAVR